MNTQFNKKIIGICLVIFAAVMISPWLNRPFTGHHDFTGAFDSLMARNYLRYGLIQTKLGQVTSLAGVQPENFSYHTHHPPGVPLLIAAVYKIFGEHEWAARAEFAAFGLGSVYLLFLLGKNFSGNTGWQAAVLMSSTILFIYVSVMPVYESPALFLMLIQFYGFCRFTETGRKRYLALMTAGAFGGYIIAWVTYFAAPILLVNEIRIRRWKYIRLLLTFIGAGAGFFGLHLWHTKILTGSWFGGGLGAIFLHRLSATEETDPRYAFNLVSYVTTIARRIFDFYGWPILIAAGLGSAVITTDKTRKNERWLWYVLLGTALSLPIVFRNYVFVHDYLLFYFSPILGLSAAVGINTILGRLVPKFDDGRWVPAVVATAGLALAGYLSTKIVWQDLRSSLEWYEASKIIGERLRRTTKPGQMILVMNTKLYDQEMQMQYYADRPILFPVNGVGSKATGGLDPDIIVNVTSDYQFPAAALEKILNVYRLETDYGIEYYYRR
ncbi:glycosyltransferase family 39 protein [Candidatus Collierbacteria bacterium]|nr:glycosyltransferase family 39 protein [Candidatus Collierbacteria bacterium]